MSEAHNKIGRAILKGLFYTGAVAIAASSPVFARNIPRIIRAIKLDLQRKKREKAFKNSFYYLRKSGYIRFENKKGQIFISLTKEGKEKAKLCLIDNLKIMKPSKWDRKWRILIFDISDSHKLKREALRGKIKQLGMFQLQKSVWIHPYDFSKEIDYLRTFFYLSKKELQIIVTSEIEDDSEARKFFNLE
jgi:DNA-binding transcriptional regulator PaaX